MFSENLPAETCSHEWSMDKRHAAMLGKIVETVSPKNIVEVGCFMGVSTAFILDASLTVRPQSIGLIDIDIRNEVRDLALQAVSLGQSVTTVVAPSDVALGMWLKTMCHPPGDALVLLDGDHSLPSVKKEVAIVLENAVPHIVLHDATNFSPDCLGAVWAMHELQSQGYLCLLDCKPRDGERTHRGLAYLTTSRQAYESVRSKVFFSS